MQGYENLSPMDVINQGKETIDKYWEDRINKMRLQVNDMVSETGQVDPTMVGVLELMEKAVAIRQYDRPSHHTYEKTQRLVRIRVNVAKSIIDKLFGVETIGVYGVGLYAVVDGLLLSGSFRDKSNFDKIGKKGVVYDLSDIPDDIKEEYNFGLSVPAFEGIFVPKKSVLTSWISRSSQIQFFDMTI